MRRDSAPYDFVLVLAALLLVLELMHVALS